MAIGIDDALAMMGGAVSGMSVGDLSGGWSSYSSGKSKTKYAAEKSAWLAGQNYDLQQRAYRESPLAIREGLEKAGINPLLATSAFGNASAGSGGSVGWSGGNSGVGFDGDKMLTKKDREDIRENTIEGGKANVDRTKAETDAIRSETQLKKITTAATALGTLGTAAYGAKKVFDRLEASRGVKPVPFAAPAKKMVNGKLVSVAEGSRGFGFGSLLNALPFLPSLWSAMKGAQDKARSEGRPSFTHHMSAGW